MSFYEQPTDPAEIVADLRTFYGIVDALQPLTDAVHETIATIMDCRAVAEKASEIIAKSERLAAVVEQSHDLNYYGKFHVVRFEQGWIVYREGRAAFLCGKSFYVKYFPSAGEALDACDELMAHEGEEKP